MRIIIVSEDGTEICFDIRPGTLLSTLLNAYKSAKRTSAAYDFCFDGELLDPRKTMKALGLRTDDRLEASLHDSTIFYICLNLTYAKLSCSRNRNLNIVNISLRVGSAVNFQTIGKVLQNRLGLDHVPHILFDQELVSLTETVESLGLANGDELAVY